MTIGTLFTLFVVPSVYILIAKDHTHDRERRAQLEAERAQDGSGIDQPAYDA
jgi:multidrug efflux pump